MKKSPLLLILALSLGAFAYGCGSSGSSHLTPPKVVTITFASGRALDGSDALNAPNGTFNIWVVNVDGSGATPLTRLTAASSFSPVIWLPDGKIVFDSKRALDGTDAANLNGTCNIWIMNADGSSPAPLTERTASGAGNELPGVACLF